ncbi:hypothetical protein [Streptomyces sp. NPDC087294]|uniref:hypothetical protein n=1 Tax=Streptomyces sp. NPDC087294 TaxID=3365777 RepID=UPI0038091B5B
MNHAQLIALGRSLRVVGEHGQRDGEDSTVSTDEIRQDLERSLALLDDVISAPRPTTRCPEHPTGPVDKDAADGRRMRPTPFGRKVAAATKRLIGPGGPP